MSKLRERLLLGALAASLAGVVFGTYQVVTHWHPRTGESASPLPTSLAQVSNAQANVDPGVPLRRPAPNFTLTNQFGQTVSLKQFRGKVVILAFIDSKGTTVDPLTAVVLRNVLHDLASYRSQVQVVAVNANPVATGVQDVYAWSQSHSMLHHWQYVTGPAAVLKKVWSSYYVSTQVIHKDLVQHTPVVMVITPQGQEHWLYLNASSGSQPVLSTEVHHLMTHIAPLLPGHPSLSHFPAARELTYLAGTLGPAQNAHPFSASAVQPGGHITSIHVGYGRQPVLLDFFATWCPDCQEEIPPLKAYSRYASAHHLPGVVGVDLRLSQSSTAQVIHYAEAKQIPYPIALDSTGSISDAYGVSGLPTEVLVSAQGSILWYHQGLIPESALMQAVHQHLAS